MSQNNAILSHLKSARSITPLQALRLFGCLRLAARIQDLRDSGHRIETMMVPTDSGKLIGSYSLVKEKQYGE